jgi:Flp pilus assembly protein TadB
MRTAARCAALLFVVAAALFAVGVAAEHNSHTESATVERAHDESAQASGGEEGEGEAVHGEGASEAPRQEASEEAETVLGLDIESPATVAFAVAVSLLLAAGLWFRPLRWIAVAAIAFAVLFAAFDVAEILHQLDESKRELAALAAVVAGCHAAAAAASGRTAAAVRPLVRDNR